MFQSLFFFKGRGFLVNPVLVPLNALTSKLVGSTPCAGLLAEGAAPTAPVLAQFVSVGMVNVSALRRAIGGNRPWKAVSVLLPCIALNHLQTCLNVAFDKWDDPLCGNISDRGLDFTARREWFFHTVGNGK